MSDIFFGIDFGTTNSALAVNSQGVVRVLPVDHDRNGSPLHVLRSVLFLENQGKVFAGWQALECYQEDSTAGRFIRSIKSLLRMRTVSQTEIRGKKYELSDLIAFILRKLKQIGEEHCGTTVHELVLGRPVIFSEDRSLDQLAESRLYEAAEKAGFVTIRFQPEPIAAALAFESSLSPTDERIVLIGDFGGGTSDFTIIRLSGKYLNTNRDRGRDILGLGGVYVGGDTFDSTLMWEIVSPHLGRDVEINLQSGGTTRIPNHIMENVRYWHFLMRLRDPAIKAYLRQIQQKCSDPQAIQNLLDLIKSDRAFELFQELERTKCALSEHPVSPLYFENESLRIKQNVGRPFFDSISQPTYEAIEKCVDETLTTAGLSTSQVNLVFLTGGTSLIPHVQRIFERRFGTNKMRSGDAFTSVVHGLGASGYLF